MQEHRQAVLIQRAAIASITLALTLTLLKLAGAIITGSVAVLASLVDSLTDLAASAITFISVQVSIQPPDRAHRFGHGKAEALSALAQSALVGGAALFVLVEAARRVLEPRPPAAEGIGIMLMLLASGLTLVLLAYQRHVVTSTGSEAIAADSLHYRSDLATNVTVILSLLLSGPAGLWWFDILFGLGITLWLLRGALIIGRQAVDTLMDRELPDPARARIEAAVRSHPEVVDLHDLRTRRSAGRVFVEMHIELPPAMTVEAAHAVCEAVERAIRALFPNAEIILHQEPAGIADERLDHRLNGRSAA